MAAALNNLPNSLQNLDPGPRLGDIKAISDALSGGTGSSSQTAVTASTTQTQAGGTKITASITNITVASSSDAVTMPQAKPGMTLVLINSSGQTIQLFPFLGDAINAASPNAAVTVATATTSIYVSAKTLQWWGGAITNEA